MAAYVFDYIDCLVHMLNSRSACPTLKEIKMSPIMFFSDNESSGQFYYFWSVALFIGSVCVCVRVWQYNPDYDKVIQNIIEAVK